VQVIASHAEQANPGIIDQNEQLLRRAPERW